MLHLLLLTTAQNLIIADQKGKRATTKKATEFQSISKLTNIFTFWPLYLLYSENSEVIIDYAILVTCP